MRRSAAVSSSYARAGNGQFGLLAVTHQQLGIKTYSIRIPVLAHLQGAGRRPEVFDKITETWSGNHLFRASVTLAKV